MYAPIRDGIDRAAVAVRYTVDRPPRPLSDLVHSYWELKTEHTLAEDFVLHAVPDACVNILFNQIEPDIAGVTALRTQHAALDLGRSFHYVGIELLPGVWQGRREELADRFVGTPYVGELPLVATSRALARCDFDAKKEIMSALVREFIARGLLVRNPVTRRILDRLDAIRSVADMAAVARLSPRQLQRNLLRTTGLSPHDLLKVLRLQLSFRRHYLDLYADQPHYIHSFRRMVGYTPARYMAKFDVRSTQYEPLIDP